MLTLRRGISLIGNNFNKTMSTLSSSSNDVKLEVINKTGIITLNKVKTLNSLNLSMVRTIYPTLKQWENDKSVDAVIITSSSEKAFCAGGDVVDVTVNLKGKSEQTDFFKEEYMLNNLIGSMKVPYIALIHGITMGGGVGLSVHGKYRVATEKTLFAMPETGIGLFPDVGGSWFLPRLPLGPHLGMYLGLTGYRLKGNSVFHAGVATHLVKFDQLNELKNEIINNGKEEIENILSKFHGNFPESKFSLQDNLSDIEKHFSFTDNIDTILQSLKDDENNPWSQKTLKDILRMSPSALKVTFRQLVEGAQKSSLKECLEMEYRIVNQCCKDNDFYEGVRALLVDKDNNPTWNPSSLNEVKNIDSYFSPLPNGKELPV